MGTSPFGGPTLHALSKQTLAVYTAPPRPKGRGHHVQKSFIHDIAESLSLPVFTPLILKNTHTQQHLESLQPDVIIVVAYGYILPQAVLNIPKYGCINIHGSLLPRWRGAAPIQRAIQYGDQEIGVTIMTMDVGLDSGPILAKSSIPLDFNFTTTMMMERLSYMGRDALLNVLGHIDTIIPKEQDTSLVTYAHKIQKNENILDPMESVYVLQRKINAFTPWPGTQYKDFKILKSNVVPGIFAEIGQFVHVSGCILGLQCYDGVLNIESIQIPSKKPMSAQEFMNGYVTLLK
jgi:methionyl-tRNA formyltransferase